MKLWGFNKLSSANVRSTFVVFSRLNDRSGCAGPLEGSEVPTDWTLCSLQRQSAGVMSNDGFRCRDFQPREMSFRASETPSQTKDCMHGQVVRKMTGDTSKKNLQPRLLGRSVCFIYFVGVNEAAGYPKVRERQRPIADVPRVTRHLASRKSSTHLQVSGQGRAGLCMCWVGGGSQTIPFWYFHSVGNRSYKSPPPPPVDSPAPSPLSYPRFAVHHSSF